MPCAKSKYAVPSQRLLNFTIFDDFRPSVYPPLVITHHRWGKIIKTHFYLQFHFSALFSIFLKQFSFSVSNPSGEKLFGTAYRVYSLGLRQCLWYPTCSQSRRQRERPKALCNSYFFLRLSQFLHSYSPFVLPTEAFLSKRPVNEVHDSPPIPDTNFHPTVA